MKIEYSINRRVALQGSRCSLPQGGRTLGGSSGGEGRGKKLILLLLLLVAPTPDPPPQPRSELPEPQLCTEKMQQQKLSWWKVGDVESRSSLSQNTSSSFPGVPPPQSPAWPPTSITPAHPVPQSRGEVWEGRGAAPPLPPAHPHPTLPCFIFFSAT